MLSEIDLYWFVCCGQTVEKQLGASESSFAVSGLETGKKYIVTIIAYRGNKRSKVVETIFKTGPHTLLQTLLSSLKPCITFMMLLEVIYVHITSFSLVGLLYPFPMDCIQILKNGNKKSGIYTIYINNDRSKPIEVYCDMDTDGGGWLV